MYVISIHSVSDPEAFWSAQLDLPEGTELPIVAPNTDGTRGVCVFRSDSVDTVRNLVDDELPRAVPLVDRAGPVHGKPEPHPVQRGVAEMALADLPD